jgi:hypothetical protein
MHHDDECPHCVRGCSAAALLFALAVPLGAQQRSVIRAGLSSMAGAVRRSRRAWSWRTAGLPRVSGAPMDPASYDLSRLTVLPGQR